MKELSNFQKEFLAQSGTLEVFTQAEFDEALTLSKAEIMAVAIETTKQAILIERQASADLVDSLADQEDEGELCTAMRDAAQAIRNRLPAQRQ